MSFLLLALLPFAGLLALDAATQDHVVAENAPVACVAWPNEATRARLEQAAARAPAPH